MNVTMILLLLFGVLLVATGFFLKWLWFDRVGKRKKDANEHTNYVIGGLN